MFVFSNYVNAEFEPFFKGNWGINVEKLKFMENMALNSEDVDYNYRALSYDKIINHISFKREYLFQDDKLFLVSLELKQSDIGYSEFKNLMKFFDDTIPEILQKKVQYMFIGDYTDKCESDYIRRVAYFNTNTTLCYYLAIWNGEKKRHYLIVNFFDNLNNLNTAKEYFLKLWDDNTHEHIKGVINP